MRIVIIDDHALFRDGLALAIRSRFPDCSVVEATSVNDALERIEDERRSIDIILADLLYPGAEPFGPLQALLSRVPNIPVIVVSALESAFYVEQAMTLGARGFVYKSSTSHQLAEAIAAVRSGGSYWPPDTSDAAQGADGDVAWCGVTVPNRNGIRSLTPRQYEVLKLLMQGKSNKEIARDLGLFEGTVKVHLKSVLQKLGAQNRTQAVIIASKLLEGAESAPDA